MESEIPIDIHSNKLLDWLISRRHVQRDWQADVLKIREKINNAIKDMPQHDGIISLLSGSYINYYHCKSIVDILKETESSSKNLFGQYGSQRMKDWQEIIKLYEKNNVYLGEVASMLIRNVNYEVPGLKKQVAKLNHSQVEFDKKLVDYDKLYNSLKNEVNANFKSLGIKGKNIKRELLQRTNSELPQLNSQACNSLKEVQEIVNYYQNIVSVVCLQPREVLPLVKYVLEKGDITVYEWKYGKSPSSVELPQLTVSDGDEEKNGDVIDFGGIELVDGEIDWGITTDDEPIEQEVTLDESVARGDEARTILGNVTTRNQLINELMELEAFLKLRHLEMSSTDQVLVLPESLSIHDREAIATWLETVRGILKQFVNPAAVHFLNIATNPRYIDQLTNKLKDKLSNMEKMIVAKNCVKTRKVEVDEEIKSIEPKIKQLIDNTRNLQEMIEQDISVRYNGRPVNLIGGVNTL